MNSNAEIDYCPPEQDKHRSGDVMARVDAVVKTWTSYALWVLITVLAGCAAPSGGPPASPPVPPAASPTPPAAAAPEAPPPPPPALPAPSTLLGLGPADTMLLLGTPDLVRRDDSVQIHQYRDGACVLDLIFYEGPDAGPFALRAYDARDRLGQPFDGAACLDRVKRREPTP